VKGKVKGSSLDEKVFLKEGNAVCQNPELCNFGENWKELRMAWG